MNIHGYVVAALALSAMAADTASAKPSYIEADPGQLASAYGKKVAGRAFSDELTDTRTAIIKAGVSPDEGCGADPKFTLSAAFPYKLGEDDVAWIERYDVGCKSTLHRAILVLLKDGEFKTMPLLPGATIADPNLQVDASNMVTTAAMLRTKKPCEEAAITDTEVTRAPPASGGAWTERWSVRTCDEVQTIDVTFTPSADGGTDISVPPA